MMMTANSLSSPFNVITTLTNSNALLSKKAFHARLEQRRLQHEQQQESVKRVNQSVKKSANQSRAQFIGSLRFELNQGVLMVRSVSRSMPTPTKWIRRYLKKLGVRRVGKSLSNGVLFTGDAVTEILTCLQAKQAKNDTIPFELNISALPILTWFRSPLSLGTPTLEAQYS
ncbi:hypothetical protein [Vibrio alginolyticus]|uniref:hypothetical protein n=1 Tax=Vibrio alginolyticus TaxID=663 RepID=UPI0012FA285F|nr:hypothetical protein [Vibrio alginolyticus]